MREIVSPLDGFLSPFGRISGSGGGGADAYAIGGASPELVAAFTLASDGTTAGEYFRKASSETTFDGLFTFSRSGTATYFDSNGTLQTAADGGARRNAYYYNAAWAKGGLLAESAAATNLFTYSDLSTGWSSSNVTWTQDATTANGISFGLLTKTATAEGHRGLDESSSTAGQYAVSFYVIQGNKQWCFLRGTGSGSGGFRQYFDLTNGVLGTASVYGGDTIDDAFIEPLGGGVYRLTVICTVGAYRHIWAVTPCDADNTIVGAVGSTLYVGQADYVAGTTPSSPIITSGSTVARAAETLSIAGADTPANTTAMSISMKGLASWGGTETGRFFNFYASANDRFSILRNGTTNTYLSNRVDPTSASTVAAAYSAGINVPFNVACYVTASGNQNIAKDGTAATAVSSAGAPNVSGGTLHLFRYFSGLTPTNGFITELRMWGSDIGDSGIAEVTS